MEGDKDSETSGPPAKLEKARADVMKQPAVKVTGDHKIASLFAKAFPEAKTIEVLSVGENNAVALVDGVPRKLSLE